jgi:hypothetical protein
LNAPLQTLRFVGPVRWEAGPGPAWVTLVGRLAPESAAAQATPAQLSLLCAQRPQLPAELLDLTVQWLAPPAVVLRAGSREWPLACATWQLHHDVGARFYAAIPPRPTPWARRLGWRVLLGIAGTGAGRWLLSRRSRARQQ